MARPRTISDDEILDVARQVFLEEGPAASTSVIATRLGLSQAALFKRFRTKMALMHAAFGLPDKPTWIGLAEQGPDDRPVPEQLAQIGAAVLAFMAHLMPRVSVLKAQGLRYDEMWADHEVPPPVVGQRTLTAWFERAMARGLVRQGDPVGLSIMFLGMFHSHAFWTHVVGQGHVNMPDARYIPLVIDVFWKGVAPGESES